MIGEISRASLVSISDSVGRSQCPREQRQDAGEGSEAEPHDEWQKCGVTWVSSSEDEKPQEGKN